MRVLNTAQMREADRRTIDDLGVSVHEGVVQVLHVTNLLGGFGAVVAGEDVVHRNRIPRGVIGIAKGHAIGGRLNGGNGTTGPHGFDHGGKVGKALRIEARGRASSGSEIRNWACKVTGDGQEAHGKRLAGVGVVSSMIGLRIGRHSWCVDGRRSIFPGFEAQEGK